MSNFVVVGAQWGDEGKGKIIDVLTRDADYVVRYQGGNNAGHTVVIGEETFILHLIPSGIFHRGKKCVIGNGVVVDPAILLEEIDHLRARNITVEGRLFVSDQAHVIFPYHKAMDKIKESRMGKGKIGTTGRGIGPCYVDKMGRCGIRFADIFDERLFEKKLKENLAEKNELFTKVYDYPPFSFDEVFKKYRGYASSLRQYSCNCSVLLNQAMSEGASILFEGAQGTMLDIDFGTYPFVTSSNSTAGGATIGCGIGPTKIDQVIGVVKAYTTRVGEGPFPTELAASDMEFLREKGREFGATTGRPRRCGWFDAVVVRYAAMVNGMNFVALTKLDVLDEMKKIQICVGYTIRGRRVDVIPSDIELLWEAQPVYEEMDGWLQDTSNVNSFDMLPGKCKEYLGRIEELVGVKISMISVGSERTQIFMVD
ncbi:MAG: adenylosuccinate synthase [Candidatus Omnitrophica bacterium]|nr:adenylosuccinate synthase [Candidatus Omnitrophota bacterium]